MAEHEAGVRQVARDEGVAPRMTIRSHHLHFLGWALGLGLGTGTGMRLELHIGSPEAVAIAFAEQVMNWREDRNGVPYHEYYARTTVGQDGENLAAYIKSLRDGLHEMIEAPDEQLMTIVEEVPDTIICERMKACGLADHCRRKMAEIVPKVLYPLSERRDMTIFLAAATCCRINFEIEAGESNYSDSDQIQVRRVTLPAGDIRRVLRFMAQPGSGFEKFFEDF